MTTLEFDYNTDMDEKYDEINEALQRVRLPDSADDPTIMEMSMDSSSVMDLSISTNASGDNIYSYIEDTVVPEIERISGVSEVEHARRHPRICPGGAARGGDGPVRPVDDRRLQRHC